MGMITILGRSDGDVERFEEAVKKADEILAAKGIQNAPILAIPDGVSVMVV